MFGELKMDDILDEVGSAKKAIKNKSAFRWRKALCSWSWARTSDPL